MPLSDGEHPNVRIRPPANFGSRPKLVAREVKAEDRAAPGTAVRIVPKANMHYIMYFIDNNIA